VEELRGEEHEGGEERVNRSTSSVYIPFYIPAYKYIIFISLHITIVDPISPIAHRCSCNDDSHEVETTDHDYLTI